MQELNYRLTEETKVNAHGVKLYRIEAIRDIPVFGVSAGDKGGWVEGTKNLGDAWVSGEAQVFGNARVFGDARVADGAWVFGNARVSGDAQVAGDARVFDGAWVFGNARVFGDARVAGKARVFDDTWVTGEARVFGNAQVAGKSWVADGAWVSGNAQVDGEARVADDADYFTLTTYTSQQLHTTLFREKDGKHKIIMGCWSGTVEQLEELFESETWVETSGVECDFARPEMLALVEVFKARIARWGNQ